MSESGLDAAQKAHLRDAMLAAGRVILQIRTQGTRHETKADGSPVTEADQRAEAILLAALRQAAPDLPVIAEEEAATGRLPDTGKAFFLVDPLDGTKEFIRGGTDFTVNIGLVRSNRPVFGMIYTPARGRFHEGETGLGAWMADIDCQSRPVFGEAHRTPVQVRQPDPQSLTAVASRSHRSEATNAWLKEQGITETISAGSSLKFCLLAEGKADVYPRHGPTMEWDTAAGHAILAAAGGRVKNLDGSSFLYGKRNQDKPFLNPGFIAYGGL